MNGYTNQHFNFKAKVIKLASRVIQIAVPLINTLSIFVAMVNGSPSKTTKSASLPDSILPTRSDTPMISAEFNVIARNAVAAGRPSRIAKAASNRNPFIGRKG